MTIQHATKASNVSLPLTGGKLHASVVSFKEDEEDKAKEMNKITESKPYNRRCVSR